MEFLIFLLFLIIICGSLGIIFVINYNKMMYLKNKIDQCEATIDETLRERYDLLVRANSIVKSEIKDNKDYFKEYLNIKNKNLTNFEMDRKLKGAFLLLSKFKDDYIELQSNDELKKIFDDIKDSNEKLTANTNYFNTKMGILNGYIRQFPSNIVAKICKLKIRPFFDGKDMSDDIYDDFKL